MVPLIDKLIAERAIVSKILLVNERAPDRSGFELFNNREAIPGWAEAAKLAATI
jgi:hypothetical protein